MNLQKIKIHKIYFIYEMNNCKIKINNEMNKLIV
jgi:hypothetical protein